MKKSLLFASIFCIALSFQSNAQFTFSASPGINLNTASFGYRSGNFVPFIGLQFLNVNGSYEENGSLYEDYSTSGKLNVLMPPIGLKYFAVEVDDINAYFTGSFSMPFISGSGETDGTTDPEVEEAFDNVSAWGAQLGFGTEYFFSEHFSLGGEFGLNFIHGKAEGEYTEYDYDPVSGTDTENTVETITKIGFNPTYTKVSLNFYF